MDDSSWEALDVDDSDLTSLLYPSKTLLPCKRPQPQITKKTINLISLEPCSQIPRFPISQSQQPKFTNPLETLDSQSQKTLPHFQNNNKEKEKEKEKESPSSSSKRLIPGPAGNIQAAMNRQALNNRNTEDRISTQEFLRRKQEDEEDDDQDFKRNSWLCAMEFLGNEGGSKGFSVLAGNVALRSPLSSIKTHRNDRVPQVVAVIKSCTPNGLGDLSVTLKDPTGTIGANIHRKVITESEFGKDISVGSVLILQQVVLFSPSHSAHYLNITLRNMVKVISKNSGPPTKTYYTSTDRLAARGTDERREVMPQVVGKSSFVRCREDEGVVNNAVRDKGKKSVDYDIQIEESRPARETFHFSNTSNRHRNAAEVESLLMRRKESDGTTVEAVRRHSNNANRTIDSNDCRSKEASQSKAFNCSTTAISVEEDIHPHESGRTTEVKKPKQQLISTTSLPQWTDEQLDELFADS